MGPSRLGLLVALFFLGGVAAMDDWKRYCHDVSPQTYNMCATAIRSDLPTVPTHGSFEVSWVRRGITMYTPEQTKIFKDLSLWHSGIIIEDLASRQTMLLQYEALNFDPSNILLPVVDVEAHTLEWNNTAVVGWLPEPNMSKWDLTIRMGTVNGTVLNKWFDWVPGFGAAHPGYTVFSVWEQAGLIPAKRNSFEFHRDTMCHRFTEDGLRAFHAVGADFSTVTQPLCRNYFSLIKQKSVAITTIDRFKGSAWDQLVGYYEDFISLFSRKIKSLDDLQKLFGDLAQDYEGFVYIADTLLGPSPTPGPQPASKYTVGEHVEGLYKDGYWYAASIEKIDSDGSYTLIWADGGTDDTVKIESKIRLPYTLGEQVEGLYKDGIWYKATIVKISSDVTYTLEWADGGTDDTVKPESKIRQRAQSPTPSPGPQPSSKYTVGEQVEGLYEDGYWYAARILKVNSDGSYTLTWADGGTDDTIKPVSKIRLPYTVGEQVEGLYKDGHWYKATIAKINSDGTYTLKWADGGTDDAVKPESKIRQRADSDTGDIVKARGNYQHRASGNYYKVPLAKPYLAYVIQRMKLPWQGNGSGLDPLECYSHEGAAIPNFLKSLFPDRTAIIV